MQILVLAYADNVQIIGPIQEAMTAASDFKSRVQQINLQLNDADSNIHCPERVLDALVQPFSMTAQSRIEGSNASIPRSSVGFMVLGCPVGTEIYLRSRANALLADIQQETSKLAKFPHHHHRTKVLVFGTNTRFVYHARSWPCSLSLTHTRVCPR
mmetsp:Transcript_37742/g.100221  ORF Transcript_37742/g.100221 Transcript_37742/m.100221 type:complete len:156 (+) Transcript_37742:171-638(+)